MSELESKLLQTKEALDDHRSLPFMRRVLRRAMGNYPGELDRESLRRHELGVDGRVIEDVIKAVRWSQKANKTPTAILKGQWVTSSITGDGVSAAIPAEVPELSFVKTPLTKMFEDGRHSTASGFDGIGFAVGNFERGASVEQNAKANDTVTLVAFRDFNAVDAINISRDQILGMDEATQAAIEAAAFIVEDNAFYTYLHSKPDNVG